MCVILIEFDENDENSGWSLIFADFGIFVNLNTVWDILEISSEYCDFSFF